MQSRPGLKDHLCLCRFSPKEKNSARRKPLTPRQAFLATGFQTMVSNGRCDNAQHPIVLSYMGEPIGTRVVP
jgi:hypothetical protein